MVQLIVFTIGKSHCAMRYAEGLMWKMKGVRLILPRRLSLTAWGVITIVVGSFIFGQSTSIALMELVHKF